MIAAMVMALALSSAVTVVSCSSASDAQPAPQQAPRKVDMGDYEVVENWPKPLPDTDLPHKGWTWGSGSGVWAESPDKVWVAQRGEIALPPGAEPWSCVMRSERSCPMVRPATWSHAVSRVAL